jgi:hypothetical protein
LLYVSIIIFLLLVRLFSYVVHCAWGDYAGWTTCSTTCNGGTRTRTRLEATLAANGGNPCSGSATETEGCSPDPCPGSKILEVMQKLILKNIIVIVKCFYYHIFTTRTIIFICSSLRMG